MSARRSEPTEDQVTAAFREAQQRIAQAVRDRATILDLRSLGLTSVPPAHETLREVQLGKNLYS